MCTSRSQNTEMFCWNMGWKNKPSVKGMRLLQTVELWPVIGSRRTNEPIGFRVSGGGGIIHADNEKCDQWERGSRAPRVRTPYRLIQLRSVHKLKVTTRQDGGSNVLRWKKGEQLSQWQFSLYLYNQYNKKINSLLCNAINRKDNNKSGQNELQLIIDSFQKDALQCKGLYSLREINVKNMLKKRGFHGWYFTYREVCTSMCTSNRNNI